MTLAMVYQYTSRCIRKDALDPDLHALAHVDLNHQAISHTSSYTPDFPLYGLK